MTNTNTNTVSWQYNYCNINGLYQDWVGIHSPEPVLPTDGWLITGSVGVDVILEELGLVTRKNRKEKTIKSQFMQWYFNE